MRPIVNWSAELPNETGFEMSDRFVPSRRLPQALQALGVATLVTWSGCSASSHGIEQVSSALAARRAADAGMAAGYAAAPAKAGSSVPTPAVEEPARETPTSLRAYIMHALAHNPELHAAALVAQAKGERFAQVTALPDPMVGMKVLPEPVRTGRPSTP